MARKPLAATRCLLGLAGGNFALDSIEKTDEFLGTMALHVPPDTLPSMIHCAKKVVVR